MKFIIPLLSLFIGLLAPSLVAAGCTNLNTRIYVTKPDNRYRDNGDWTITDLITGLTWRKCPLGLDLQDCSRGTVLSLNWSDALRAANGHADDNGFIDWRIPNKNELDSLVEYACSLPAINDTIFPNGANIENAYGTYWTSTPAAWDARRVWTVSFRHGGPSYNNKDDNYLIRLVRGGVVLDNPQIINPPTQGE